MKILACILTTLSRTCKLNAKHTFKHTHTQLADNSINCHFPNIFFFFFVILLYFHSLNPFRFRILRLYLSVDKALPSGQQTVILEIFKDFILFNNHKTRDSLPKTTTTTTFKHFDTSHTHTSKEIVFLYVKDSCSICSWCANTSEQVTITTTEHREKRKKKK